MLWRAMLVIAVAGAGTAAGRQPAGPHSCLSLSPPGCSQVVAMLWKFCSRGACALGLIFIQELLSRFWHGPEWVGRQDSACICRVSTGTGESAVDSFPWQKLGKVYWASSPILFTVTLGTCSYPRHGWYLLCAVYCVS